MRRWIYRASMCGLIATFIVALTPPTALGTEGSSSPEGMVWVAGGEFQMGANDTDASHGELEAHRVRLDGFWIDQTDVTNAQFRRFIEASGYVTTAERKVDWEQLQKQVPPGTPRPPEEKLQPGSLVFVPPDHPVPLDDPSAWWSWVSGADWKHPGGPRTSIAGKDDHPVVQVSWDDAHAYVRWAGKSLPTEAQWEYAARGGLKATRYAWGDEAPSEQSPRCNIWHGHFPDRPTLRGTPPGTMPVKTFLPNGLGLYDMAGNVWQWCADWYSPGGRPEVKDIAVNPTGPEKSFDPADPLMPKRVVRGGSFLCSAEYCCGYRLTARQGTSPDSSLQHTGFRCVLMVASK